MPTQDHTHCRPSDARFYAIGSVVVALMLVLGLFLGASAGQAHNIASPVVMVLEFPDLNAKAEGHQYSRPGLVPAYAWKADLLIFPGHTAKIRSWEVWPEIPGGPNLRPFGVSKSYSLGGRPNEVDKVVGHVMYANALENYAVERCNANAQQLRAQGKSNDWIYSRQHELAFQVDMELKYEFRVGFDSHMNAGGNGMPSRKVICQAAPGVPGPTRNPSSEPPPRVPPEIGVESSSLVTIERSAVNGLCQVKTSGVIRTNRPNTTVKFRYADALGHQSDVKTVKTDHSSTVFFVHQYDIPKNPSGREEGKIRLVGVSTPFTSGWSDYSMDCRDGSAPGGLADPNPAKPPPGGPAGSPSGLASQGRATHGGSSPATGTGQGSKPQAIPQSEPRSGADKMVADVAVTRLQVKAVGQRGTASGRVDNLGTKDASLRYLLVVRSADGKEALRKAGTLNLRPGQNRAFEFAFPAARGARYEAELSVRTAGDAKPGNNRRTASSGR